MANERVQTPDIAHPVGFMAAILEYCRKSTFIGLLEYAGRLSVLVAVISFLANIGSWKDERDHTAWTTINTAANQRGSGGRREALETLARDRVSLAEVSAPFAFLHGVDLRTKWTPLSWPLNDPKRTDLRAANFGGSTLSNAKLQNTDLSRAYLGWASLRGAHLEGSDLTGATLTCADLTGAYLVRATLPADANLASGACLTGADGIDVNAVTWAHVCGIPNHEPCNESFFQKYDCGEKHACEDG